MTKRRLAVVLFNLGGPDGPKAVRPFLFNLFNDPAIITVPGPARLALALLISTTRTKSAIANYARMGGASPLLPETEDQAALLEAGLAKALPEVEAKVFIAMRYWRPDTAQAARAVKAFAPDDIVLLPLYPQFSTTTTASSFDAWSKAYDGPGASHAVCCYPLAEGLLQAHAERILEAWRAAGSPEPVRLLFSAHGLPEAIVKTGDPYQAEVEATAAAVAARLGPGWDWAVCYQSKVGRLKWLGPSTTEAIEAAAAEGKGVVVSPIAFVSEHIETLVELDYDYAEFASDKGVTTYVRAPALGVHEAFGAALVEAVAAALGRDPGLAPMGPWRCPAPFGRCPARHKDAA
jgi:ferrochelatase